MTMTEDIAFHYPPELFIARPSLRHCNLCAGPGQGLSACALPNDSQGDKAKAFFHHRTRFPRHPHLPPKGEKCYPCVRYEMSPMSQAVQ